VCFVSIWFISTVRESFRNVPCAILADRCSGAYMENPWSTGKRKLRWGRAICCRVRSISHHGSLTAFAQPLVLAAR